MISINCCSVIYALVIEISRSVEPQCNYAFWPLFFLIIGIVGAATISIACCVSKDTKHVIILGSKGAGKTTLWDQLRNKIPNSMYTPTDETPIDSFSIDLDGVKRRISSTKDIGGGDNWVSLYEEIIENDTFIYYLIDITRLEELKGETRARLLKISKIIEEKELKGCGCKLLVTHLDKYNQKDMMPAKEYAKHILEVKSIDGYELPTDDSILAVNLFDDSDINSIKKEILKH